ncbi:DUF5798 family protein [Halostella salina]|uniref:DUF5798 family protein n=1 Tax=Halostella salina TaxID=1547897 RepID=UPI000EF7E2EA|nr:DUF5798 family protein [Halostella salina]
MGLGSTAKKLQNVADRAEQLYKQLADVRERVMKLEKTTTETGDRVERMETELEKQRAVLDAIAADRGIDVDQLLAEAAIEEVDDESDGEGETAAADDTAGSGESTAE